MKWTTDLFKENLKRNLITNIVIEQTLDGA
jgi:hypothetical protein